MILITFFFGGGRRTDQTAGRSEGLTGSMTIAWDDQFKRQNIMWKVPRNVRMNDNVVVREDEIAVFYRDGKVLAYLDRPDRYALTSQNAPILGRLIQALSGVVQQAEVYYLQKRIFDGKFGTQDAFLFQDPDFDMVQLRAFGDFRYRLKDPETFINQFVGTFGAATSAEVEDRIKGELVKQLNVTLGKMKANGLKVVDFAASLTEVRHDEPDDDEVLWELRSRHVRGRGEQAVHQVRQARPSGTQVLWGMRRGADSEVPRRSRRAREHEVLPGVRETRPELSPWNQLRAPRRAGLSCRIYPRRSSSRWRPLASSFSRRSSPSSCSSPSCESTSGSGGPASRR